jgi:hypothetical protein
VEQPIRNSRVSLLVTWRIGAPRSISEGPISSPRVHSLTLADARRGLCFSGRLRSPSPHPAPCKSSTSWHGETGVRIANTALRQRGCLHSREGYVSHDRLPRIRGQVHAVRPMWDTHQIGKRLSSQPIAWLRNVSAPEPSFKLTFHTAPSARRRLM